MQVLKQKAASYDKLVKDLSTILSGCYRSAPESPNVKRRKIKSKDTQGLEKNYALWRCKGCGEFHVRASRYIQLDSEGEWTFTNTVQSPCPTCGYRQRLQVKDVDIYESKKDAIFERDDLRKKINRDSWL